MALSKINRNSLNTGISDSSDATAITIDSSEKVLIGGTTDTATGGLSVKKAGGANWIANFSNTTAGTSYGVRIGEPSGASVGYPLLQVMQDYSPNGDYFRVNTGGAVTMPKQPCFRAGVQNSTGSTVGVQNNLTFNRQVIDLGNNYDPSNGRFTAPVAGTYYFSHAGLGASGSSGGTHSTGASWHVEFLLNGSRTGFQFYWYSGHPTAGGSQAHYINSYLDMIITLAANDYITVQLPDGTDSYYINPNSNGVYEPYFQGFLIA